MKRYKVTHIMNKKQLGLILVAGLFCASANAVVDLDATGTAASPVGTVMLASENKINSKDGTEVSGDVYNAEGDFGFIVPEGSTYYIRIDLGGNATFMADPSGQFTPTATRASGGAGKNYVIMSVAGAQADDAQWNLGTTGTNVTYVLKGKADVDISYKLYQNPGDAIAGGDSGALYSSSAAFIRFADATSMAGKASDAAKIDVGANSTKFEEGSITTHIMEIDILNTKGAKISADDATINLNMERVVDKITLVATGDFSAVQAITDANDKVLTAAGRVWLDKDDTCTPNVPAVPETSQGAGDGVAAIPGGHRIGADATINDAGLEATVVITNADDPADDAPDGTTDDGYFGDISKAYLCMTTNGVSVIPEITYTGELTMTAETEYTAIDEVSFTGSKIEKNSETEMLDFLLTPNGTFRNMVRLTNTSNVDGSDLMVTLINDAGDEVTFSLGDVEGISADLGPRASTPLININDLYAAAQDVDRGDDGMFTVHGEGMGNKLRARFEGNVLAGSLKAQALSVSTDSTTFFTF